MALGFSYAGALLLVLYLTSVELLSPRAMGKGRFNMPPGLREMAERMAASSTTPKPPLKNPVTHVPKYMLDLYKTLSEGNGRRRGDEPEIVRSYGNVNGGLYKKYDDIINIREEQRGGKTRIHTLAFNVASLPENERLQSAELRLYALIKRDQSTFLGVERQVTISLCHSREGGYSCDMVESRHVFERVNNWEKFNVTEAVEQWLKKSDMEQRLEIRIDSIFNSVDEGDLDIPVEPYVDTEPLLLIYSTNIHKSLENSSHVLYRRSADHEDQEEESNSILEAPVVKHVPTTRRRKHKNPCKRKNMEVNFKDINYDTWIIAPPRYEAGECSGKCYFPLSDHLTPTMHAVIQTLLNTVDPKKASRTCCVPTKLKPISLLYKDENDAIIYKLHYPDMVVGECGCR